MGMSYLWLLRALAVATLAVVCSILAGTGLMMMGGGFLVIFAAFLTVPIAFAQKYRNPVLREARHWMVSSSVGAFAGMIVGFTSSAWYREGGVYGAKWAFETAVIGISMGAMIGLAQSFSMKASVHARWLWALSNVAIYGLGSSIVVQPFRVSASVLSLVAYVLTALAALAQSLIGSERHAAR